LESKNSQERILLGKNNFHCLDNCEIKDELFLSAANFDKEWPSGRGIFISDD
jgi:hypothetical protein